MNFLTLLMLGTSMFCTCGNWKTKSAANPEVLWALSLVSIQCDTLQWYLKFLFKLYYITCINKYDSLPLISYIIHIGDIKKKNSDKSFVLSWIQVVFVDIFALFANETQLVFLFWFSYIDLFHLRLHHCYVSAIAM